MRPLHVVAAGLLPSLCAACGRSCRSGAVLCTRCTRRLAAAEPLSTSGPPGLDQAWSAASHEGVARDLVAALKFRRLLPVAGTIAEPRASVYPYFMNRRRQSGSWRCDPCRSTFVERSPRFEQLAPKLWWFRDGKSASTRQRSGEFRRKAFSRFAQDVRRILWPGHTSVSAESGCRFFLRELGPSRSAGTSHLRTTSPWRFHHHYRRDEWPAPIRREFCRVMNYFADERIQ